MTLVGSVLRVTVRKWDPDQPRDAQGRFGTGGAWDPAAKAQAEDRLRAIGVASDLTQVDPALLPVLVETIEGLHEDFPSVFRQMQIDIRCEGLGRGTFAATDTGTFFGRGRDQVTELLHGQASIILSTAYFGDRASLEKAAGDSAESGWLGGSTPEYVIEHEFGHIYDAVIGGGGPNGNRFYSLTPDYAAATAGEAAPTKYGELASHERFAETFAMLRLGETADTTEEKAVAALIADHSRRGKVAKYSPDQERDEAGRFGSGGGSNPHGSMRPTPSRAFPARRYVGDESSPDRALFEEAMLARGPYGYGDPEGGLLGTASLEQRGALKAEMAIDVGERMDTMLADMARTDLQGYNEFVRSVAASQIGFTARATHPDLAPEVPGAIPTAGIAALMADQWADTSGDHNEHALAVQLAAAEEFGLTSAADPIESYGEREGAPDPRATFESEGPAWALALRAEYTNTQAWFAERGVTEITVYRGVMLYGDERADLNPAAVQTNPLSSWSTRVESTSMFAPTASSVILAATVPVSRIVSTPFTGSGCLSEYEVVVLGGTDNVTAFDAGEGSEIVKIERAAKRAKPTNIDADLANADWPKRTPDKMSDLAPTQRLMEKWNPDQPRDEQGRFGSGGGGPSVGRLRDLLAEGGFSIDPRTGSPPTTGFMVGVPGHGRVFPLSALAGDSAVLAETVDAWLGAEAELLDTPGMYIGGWVDTDNGVVTLDVAQNVADGAEAVRLGTERDERAVYDVVNRRELPTGGTGGYAKSATLPGQEGEPVARIPIFIDRPSKPIGSMTPAERSAFAAAVVRKAQEQVARLTDAGMPIAKWDPDQPRDDRGRWGSGGGSGAPKAQGTGTSGSKPVTVIAEEIADRAAIAEPIVSAALVTAVEEGTPCTLEGFQHRLKLEARIAEKVLTDSEAKGVSPEEAAEQDIYDALRFTVQFSRGEYGEGVRETMRELTERGLQPARLKNFWNRDGYQGINSIWRTASGAKFELQFHTEESRRTIEPSHKLFEQYRTSTDPAEKARLSDAMAALWAPIHDNPPEGAREVEEFDYLKH